MPSCRSALWALVLLALVAPSARAAAPSEDTALAARLEALVEKLDAERESLHIPGMALVIVKDDEILLAKGFGLANIEEDTPVTPDTLFAIGSSSKAFTTALISMLVEEGRMDWDAPITEYLPWFELTVDSPVPDAKVTVRDLVTHRTGFTRMGLLWAGGKASRTEVLEVATGAEPWDVFRKNFHYNNVMYLAAGEAAAAVAETDYDTLLRTRLLEPLGMTSSNSSVTQSQEDPRLSPRLAMGYEWDKDAEEFKHRPMRVLDTIAPAGAINSNVIDMARWLRLQLGDGVIDGERLLAAEQIEEMRTPQIRMGGEAFYGLGWMLHDWNGRKVVEHGGNIDGFGAEVALMPEENLGFVLLTNVTATPLQSTSMPMVWAAVLGEDGEGDSDAGEATGDAPADEPIDYEQYLGEFIADYAHFDQIPFTVQVNDAGKLAVHIPGQALFELKSPDEEGLWEFVLTDTIKLSFERDPDGVVQSIVLHQNGTSFECPRPGYQYPLEFALAEVKPLVGRYDDPALRAEVEVKMDNNRLAVDIPGQMVFQLRTPGEDGIWWFRAIPELGVEFDVEGDGPARSFTFHERGSERVCTRVEGALATLPDEAAIAALCRLDERRATLDRLGAIRLAGTIRMAQSGVTGDFTWTIDGPERYLAVVDFGLFAQIEEAYGDGVGTERSSVSPFETLTGDSLRQARQDNPLMPITDWRLFADRFEVVGREDLDGRPTLLVRLTTEGLPALTLSIDAETGDTLRQQGKRMLSGLGAELPYTVRFEQYREIEGLRLPFRVVSSDDASGNAIGELEEVETGVEVEASAYVLTP